eukprot:c15354_g1_i1 orf=322-723(-)
MSSALFYLLQWSKKLFATTFNWWWVFPAISITKNFHCAKLGGATMLMTCFMFKWLNIKWQHSVNNPAIPLLLQDKCVPLLIHCVHPKLDADSQALDKPIASFEHVQEKEACWTQALIFLQQAVASSQSCIYLN